MRQFWIVMVCCMLGSSSGEVGDGNDGRPVADRPPLPEPQPAAKKARKAEDAVRERERLTMSEKLALLDHKDKNPTLKHKDLRAWCKVTFEKDPSDAFFSLLFKSDNVAKVRSFMANASTYEANKKTTTSSEYPELDKGLFTWFQGRRAMKLSPTDELMLAEAARIAAEMNITTFKCSKGFLDKFKKRHGISERGNHGDGAAVNSSGPSTSAPSTEQNILPKFFAGADMEDIYNCDETGLFYRALPVHGLSAAIRKGLKIAKDRITVMLCCNATGTHKMEPLVIGNAARPRCFGRMAANGWEPKHVGVMYFHNATSWINGVIFSGWILNFNREMQIKFKGTSRKAWLLMDKTGAHVMPKGAVARVWEVDGCSLRGFELSHTKVVYLPPNVNSVVQPLHAGIIVNFKALWRKTQLEWILGCLDQAIAKGGDARADKFKPNVRQAIMWTKTAWNSVSESIIASCWKKVNILPTAAEQELVQTHGAVRAMDAMDQQTQESLSTLMSNLLLTSADIVDVCEVGELLDPVEERFTEAPSECADQEQQKALEQALQEAAPERAASEDDSAQPESMTLHEARHAMEMLAMFVGENQDAPEMQGVGEMVVNILTKLNQMSPKPTVRHQ